MGTGVRGGNCNSRLENDLCDGVYPCEALFQKFYASHANSQGRIYRQQILEIICHTIAEGDRGGEFAMANGEVEVPFLPGVKLPARQWQMKAALQGWLSAFGQFDENGDAYFTVADARAMLMEGRMPDGWQKRRWGCVTAIGGCPLMPGGEVPKQQSQAKVANQTRLALMHMLCASTSAALVEKVEMVCRCCSSKIQQAPTAAKSRTILASILERHASFNVPMLQTHHRYGLLQL